jgi:hypothetical protein
LTSIKNHFGNKVVTYTVQLFWPSIFNILKNYNINILNGHVMLLVVHMPSLGFFKCFSILLAACCITYSGKELLKACTYLALQINTYAIRSSLLKRLTCDCSGTIVSKHSLCVFTLTKSISVFYHSTSALFKLEFLRKKLG